MASSLPGKQQLLALMRLSRDVILVRDAQGLITYCNPAIQPALGYRPAELVGTPERDLVHPSDVSVRDKVITVLLASGESRPCEVRLRHRDGTWRWFDTIDTNCLDDPAVAGIVTNARDVTERKAVEDTLTECSLHDPLTGLPNRTLLVDHLGMVLARTARQHDTLGVLFCDLDNFKSVNDGLGHRVGDLVLLEVARRVERALRASDTVARIGGDEFVALCDGLASRDEATMLAQRVRDDVEAPMAVDGTDVVVSVSIGIVTIEGEAAKHAEPMMLLDNADAAMYKAKQRGRARWEVFDESLVELAAQRRALEPELERAALDRREFVLYYQPIVRLTDGVTVGAEALLRWLHPTRGTLLPEQFLDLAEDNGLIVPIGAWVLREACQQAMRWRAGNDTPAWISVNLSARQVAEPGLADTVAEALTASGLPADALWLELTETALLRVGHSATITLAAIESLGVHLGMDDFGTGYASLTNLQRLPIDFLKIDRSFVANLTHGAHGGDNAIVAAITQLGATLDLTTVAEGIETEEEMDILRTSGCPYGQGYLIAKPSPPSHLNQLQVRRVGTGSAK